MNLVVVLELDGGPGLVGFDLEELHEVFNGGGVEILVVKSLIGEEGELGDESFHGGGIWGKFRDLGKEKSGY